MRRRLDLELVRRGLAGTRSEARDAITAGRVAVGGTLAQKPGRLVAPAEPVSLAAPARRHVSRGGEKLEAALRAFSLDAAGRRCLDAGAGTGGFTEVLLEYGARHVVAVDVGYGQLAWRLRTDPRVTPLERVNVRDLRLDDLPYSPEMVVADLSFISLEKVLPALSAVAVTDAEFVLLVKPQFEAGRAEVGRGGIVRDPAVWRTVVEQVAEASASHGLGPQGVIRSPIPGQRGNIEFLLHATKGAPAREVEPWPAPNEGDASGAP